MNEPAWKKHHFWILAGLAPVLVVLAVVFLMLGVASTASEKIAEAEGKLSTVKSTQPAGKKIIEDYAQQDEELEVQKKKLWQARWDQQKDLFNFPTTNKLLSAFLGRYNKFGEKLRETGDEKSLFKEDQVYQTAYKKMAETIAPTTFAGGSWTNVLRYVTNWTDRVPTDEQVWLALEDFWVQRGLLQPIKVVNDNAAAFTRIEGGAPPGPGAIKRSFKSPIWRVDLEVSEADQMIYGTLTNTTERLQPFGLGNKLRLLVKLSDRGQPVEYNIEGDFLKAGHLVKIVKTPQKYDPKSNVREVLARVSNHGIPPGIQVTDIVSVTQVLDTRTVPIRRIDRIAISYVDSRHALPVGQKLTTPSFMEDPEAVEGDPLMDPSMDRESGMPPGEMMPVSGPGEAGSLTPGMTGPRIGTPAQVLDANKYRYIQRTDQVRRIPVAIVLVVDQMFMQDVLVEYANSPLRIQLTQYHWQRYRGGSMTPGNSLFGQTPGSIQSSDFSSDPQSGGFGTTPGFATSTEEQASSGLIELSLYGVVNLYNQYEESVPVEAEEAQ